MLLLVLFVSITSIVSAEDATSTGATTGSNSNNPNTRGFGLGNLVNGALGAVGALQPGFGQPGFGQPGFVQPGFGQPGFVQPGIGVGAYPGQIGVNPGLVGAVSPVVNPGIASGSGSASCRRWCRTPQGQAYCCEGANEPISAAVTKQGQCPPVRPSCPPTRNFGPPRTCSSDGACAGFDKCCFDTCLQHHTCKPPIGLGRR